MLGDQRQMRRAARPAAGADHHRNARAHRRVQHQPQVAPDGDRRAERLAGAQIVRPRIDAAAVHADDMRLARPCPARNDASGKPYPRIALVDSRRISFCGIAIGVPSCPRHALFRPSQQADRSKLDIRENKRATYSMYVELQVTTNYSFLRGASHVEELFAQAAVLGLPALGVTDRNSVAGMVRAHQRAREAGVRLIVGCRLDLMDGPSVLVYPIDRPAWSRLTRLLTVGKRRAGKGRCELSLAGPVGSVRGHDWYPLHRSHARKPGPAEGRFRQPRLCGPDIAAIWE